MKPITTPASRSCEDCRRECPSSPLPHHDAREASHFLALLPQASLTASQHLRGKRAEECNPLHTELGELK